MSYVVIRELRKVFGSGSATQVAAVNGVDLDIEPGEFVSIMGASGSGKTTLLHLMAGLSRPTSGSISVGGTELGTLSERDLTLFRRKNIGVIFQAFNLIPTLKAEENILLPVLAGYKDVPMARLQSALDELMDRLNISHRRGHYPDMLSGGEQQRVAIARALLLDFATDTHGTLLLADEPTGNLDSANSEVICKLLQELCKERKHTMVMVTHEPAVAKWTDRTIVLKDGKIARL